VTSRHCDAGLRIYLRLATTALAGFDGATAKGGADTATFGLFCLGFFASRLPRRCFMDMRLTFRRRRAGHPRTVGPINGPYALSRRMYDLLLASTQSSLTDRLAGQSRQLAFEEECGRHWCLSNLSLAKGRTQRTYSRLWVALFRPYFPAINAGNPATTWRRTTMPNMDMGTYAYCF
jgi:hypothetical protein